VDMEAEFRNGTRVQVRFEQNWRWSMWVSIGGSWKRRKDFATPHSEHACRTAETWYGPPTDGWHPSRETADDDEQADPAAPPRRHRSGPQREAHPPAPGPRLHHFRSLRPVRSPRLSPARRQNPRVLVLAAARPAPALRREEQCL